MQYCAVNSEERYAAPGQGSKFYPALGQPELGGACKELYVVRPGTFVTHDPGQWGSHHQSGNVEPQSFGLKQRFSLTQHFKPRSDSEPTNATT